MKKVALIADWISDQGGAEKVFEKLMDMYPQADIYTSVFFQNNNPKYRGRNIYTSYIQKIPFLNKRHKLCILLRAHAFRRFDLSAYDIVISSASAEAKHVQTNPETTHICYCHTPTRYLWSHADEYKNMLEFGILNPLAKLVMRLTFPYLRRVDYRAAKNVDIFIANSRTTQERIQKFYKRNSVIIHPFFSGNTKEKSVKQIPESYFFAIGRVVPYKQFDLLVRTFNELPEYNLVIATRTDNSESRRLKNISKDNIKWRDDLSDEQVAYCFRNARAYIMPQEEDFGITPIESMSHGTPVIAYHKGGAVETVLEEKTGVFFDIQNISSLKSRIKKWESKNYSRSDCKQQAKNFDESVFESKIRKIIDNISPGQ